MKNPAKETDTVTLFLRIPESLKQFLSIQAKSNGNSINREIALCLEKKMSEAMRYLPVNTTFIKPEESMTGFTIRLPGNLKNRLEAWQQRITARSIMRFWYVWMPVSAKRSTCERSGISNQRKASPGPERTAGAACYA